MAQGAQYAEVVVDIAARKVDRPFHYDIPPELKKQVKPGVRVLVPFGNRKLEGYVVGLSSQSPVKKTRPILEIVAGQIPISTELLHLARWMAIYYMCPLITVLQAFFPKGKSIPRAIQEEWCSLVPLVTVEDLELARKRAPKQGEILDLLQQDGPLLVRQALQITGANRRSLTALVDKGVVRIFHQEESEVKEIFRGNNELPRLTVAQEQVLETLSKKLMPPKHQVFLLHGVTGSGKTEIYFQSITKVMASGHQALVLFPEISLTTHLIERFYKRFGHQVEVLHSGLPMRERLLTLERINAGKVSIVVGTRSAIFAPVPNLGLVILDEEHETSYQQDVTPKYHAREVAIIRAFLNKVPVILGTATPSLESYYKASHGKFQLLEMESRVEKRAMPQVEIADLRQELRRGNATLFSQLLQEKLKERLDKREQSILFLNRRGYANFFNCRDCGEAIKCERCDVSLTYYAHRNHLKCHYCGYTRSVPVLCPTCKGDRIRPLGAGTEKVEQELLALFPEARVVRIDSDTIRKKGDYARLLNLFETGEGDVLIGTQMVAKGLDFPGVTLVGVILADQMLNFPDFRARERAFQLLTQVAGRAGRGAIPGEVVVQTYSPEDATIEAAAYHDYRRFFASEIELRRLLGYPPFSHLIRILVTGEEDERCQIGCQEIAEKINQYKGKTGVISLGPTPAPLARINNIYRWQIFLKGPEIKEMRQLVGIALREVAMEGKLPRGIRLNLDIDPLGML